ncbi:MAG: hypothetical protein FWC26_04625 [Fibromonadales bacterium]|nr:hypothetical protein [Fibromonadales bacterium]
MSNKPYSTEEVLAYANANNVSKEAVYNSLRRGSLTYDMRAMAFVKKPNVAKEQPKPGFMDAFNKAEKEAYPEQTCNKVAQNEDKQAPVANNAVQLAIEHGYTCVYLTVIPEEQKQAIVDEMSRIKKENPDTPLKDLFECVFNEICNGDEQEAAV